MLVLARSPFQQIRIGRDIIITALGISRGEMKIGIEAPRDIPIVRTELIDELEANPPTLQERFAAVREAMGEQIPDVDDDTEEITVYIVRSSHGLMARVNDPKLWSNEAMVGQVVTSIPKDTK